MQPYDDLIKTMRHCVATMKCTTCPVDSIDKTAKAQQRCVTLMLAKAADAIEELSAYAELYQDLAEKNQQTARKLIDAYPRWISVEEALPLAYKDVYVTDGEYIARSNLLGDVFPGDQPCWSYSGLGEITHWCERIPLPKEET